MNTRKLFSGYVWWLRLEALVKALVTGMVVSTVINLLILLSCHLVIAVNHLWYLWFAQTPWDITQRLTTHLAELDILVLLKDTLLLGLILTVPFYFLYRPNTRKAAARVDREGQFERMSTMLALKDDDSYIATVQREDALKRLKEVKTTSLPFHISYKPFVALGALVVAICLVFVCPFWQYVSYAEPIPEDVVVESRIIADLIAQLRQTVADADVSEEIRVELNAIVNELEATVDDYDTTLTKAAKIAETRAKINAIIEREMATTDIGAVMQENETLKDLGAAIESGEEDALHAAIESLRDEMFAVPEEERQAWFESMAEQILQAIEEAGGLNPEEPDSTLTALQNLATQFQNAADLYKQEDTDPGDAPMAVGGIGLSDAEEAITDAAEEQSQVQEALQPLLDAINAAQNSLFEVEEEETPETEEGTDSEGSAGTEDPGAEGDETGGEGNESGENGETGENGEGQGGGGQGGGGQGGGGQGGGGGGEEGGNEEEIFDPSQDADFGNDDYELTDEDFERGEYGQNVINGNVPYEDVYLDYYASALQNIARADIPDSLKDVIIQYFTSLD